MLCPNCKHPAYLHYDNLGCMVSENNITCKCNIAMGQIALMIENEKLKSQLSIGIMALDNIKRNPLSQEYSSTIADLALYQISELEKK